MIKFIKAVILFLCYSPIFAATDKIVAVVYDYPITQSELIAFKNSYQILDKSDQDALNRLSKIILEQQLLEQIHAKVTDAEVEVVLQNFMQRAQMNREQLSNALADEGKNIDDFKQQIRRQEEKRRLYTYLVKKPPIITDEQITHFIRSQPIDAAKITHHFLDVILISKEAEKKPHSERLIELFKKLRHYLSTNTTYDEMTTVLKPWLKDQEQIEVQDLGWRNSSELPDLFVPIANRIQKINQISEPIFAGNGVHVLKLLGRTQPPQIGYNEAKGILFEQQLAKEVQKKLNELFKTAVIIML